MPRTGNAEPSRPDQLSKATAKLAELNGKTALVTGASSGLGVDFARQLAAAGCNLIITARRENRLKALRAELTDAHPDVSVDVIAMDLTAPKAAIQLHDEIEGWGRHVDVLINNAGFGLFGWFNEMSFERQAEMMRLNVSVPVELTHLVLSGMLSRGYGRVLFVASVAGYLATPTYALYAGTKANILLFGEALNAELRGSGVSTTVLSPGMTRTEFLEVSGQNATLGQRTMMMESPDVTRVGLEAMVKGRASVIPGWGNWFLTVLIRVFPRPWLKWAAYMVMRNDDLSA